MEENDATLDSLEDAGDIEDDFDPRKWFIIA